MTDSGTGPDPAEGRPPLGSAGDPQPGQPASGGSGPPPPPDQSGGGTWAPPPGQGGWPPPPGSPQYGGQPGYQHLPPPYGYAAPQTEGGAIGALVCAIGSFFVCPVILAVIALVLASNSDKKIAQSRGTLTGESLNRAARIIAWVHLGLFALLVAFGFIIVIIRGLGSRL